MSSTMTTTDVALPYHEPTIITVLISSSFIILLSTPGYSIDKFLYCGLVAQILIGILYGQPGAKWLTTAAQETILNLGYLGLILLVYEGGLSTSVKELKATLALSFTVAVVGISVPIGLSFILMPLANASALQAFAAGAALCSTSLGTTFTVLKASGLAKTRLGTVLSAAAMMDDVVGLVMVKIIASLGGNGDLQVGTVLRPVLVSLASATVVPLMCFFVVGPVAPKVRMRLSRVATLHSDSLQLAFVSHTLILIAFIVAVAYAGTSVLFAAYLAGAAITWHDERLEDSLEEEKALPRRKDHEAPPEAGASTVQHSNCSITHPASHANTGVAVYHAYYSTVTDLLLRPFFFASIGFSITRMFQGPIVWRGMIYATLMAIGKLVCGIPVLHTELALSGSKEHPDTKRSIFGIPRHALLLGFAMVARGEIGYLIAAVADGNGVFDGSDLFLIVCWAVSLCTLIGPMSVGLLVRSSRVNVTKS